MSRHVIALFIAGTATARPALAAEVPVKPDEQVKVGLELRIDQVNERVTWDHPDQETHRAGVTQKFTLAAAKVNLRGAIDDKTTYRLRYNFAGDFNAASAATSGVADGVQFAFVSRQVADWLTVSAGKIYIEGGSWENEYVSANVYHFSETGAQVASYDTGIMAGITLAGQVISLQVLNSVPDSAPKSGRDYVKAIAWHGSFLGGAVLPVVSYGIYPRPRQTTEGLLDDAAVTALVSAGTRINVANWELEGVFCDLKTPSYTAYANDKDATTPSVTTTKSAAESWQLVYGLARYKWANPKLEPFVKVTADRHRKDSATVGNFTRISGGIEYYPSASSPLWYHLVYVHQDNRFPAASANGAVLQAKNNQRVSSLLLGTGAVY